MRTEIRSTPAPADVGRDPTRAATLQRLASASASPTARTAEPTPGRPVGDGDPQPDLQTSPPTPPWAAADPDGVRPERLAPTEPDLEAWADPPWWRRIRWAPDRLAGIALVVLVVALGAFSVHRLVSAVPAGAPVPELPLATPGVTVEAGQPSPEGGASALGTGGTSPTQTAPSVVDEPVVVSVVGMVGRSGLVTLAPGARVADALDHAGGVVDGGDRDGLNLARRVVDGEQILVGVAPGPEGPRGPRSDIVGPGPEPAAPPGSAAGAGGAAAPGSAPAAGGGQAGPGGLVDLNTADSATLDSLPGVGPVTAAAILAWRTANGEFTSVDQLTEVDGIGPATLARLRPLVTV